MKKLVKTAFRLGLALNAALTRLPVLRAIEGRVLTPFFVWLTTRVRGAPKRAVTDDPASLGREWERLLGAGPYAKVTRIDAETGTAYGEITGPCPLRGSGDLAACHRLMAYDRKLLEPHRARLVVLASQADGRHACRVAIRAAALAHDDLVPAHAAHGGDEPRPPFG